MLEYTSHNIPILGDGELAICTDTLDVYIGYKGTNILLNNGSRELFNPPTSFQRVCGFLSADDVNGKSFPLSQYRNGDIVILSLNATTEIRDYVIEKDSNFRLNFLIEPDDTIYYEIWKTVNNKNTIPMDITVIEGKPGMQGQRGVTGPRGLRGPRGYEGVIGPTGPEGYQGPRGFIGITGPTGPKGAKGDAGSPIHVVATLSDISLLPDNPADGDCYIIGNRFYVWNNTESEWVISNDVKGNTGATGPKGDTGDRGPVGPKGAKGDIGQGIKTLGVLDSVSKLPENPSNGDSYFINQTMYTYNESERGWVNNGEFVGPTGPTGANAKNPNFKIGTVTKVNPDVDPAITLTGTYPDLKFNFSIPGPYPLPDYNNFIYCGRLSIADVGGRVIPFSSLTSAMIINNSKIKKLPANKMTMVSMGNESTTSVGDYVVIAVPHGKYTVFMIDGAGSRFRFYDDIAGANGILITLNGKQYDLYGQILPSKGEMFFTVE